MIRLENLWRTYEMGEQELHALKGIDEEVSDGEYVAIMGPSGSGKSTLLKAIASYEIQGFPQHLKVEHLLHAARRTPHAARCTPHAARCTLHAAPCTAPRGPPARSTRRRLARHHWCSASRAPGAS